MMYFYRRHCQCLDVSEQQQFFFNLTFMYHLHHLLTVRSLLCRFMLGASATIRSVYSVIYPVQSWL